MIKNIPCSITREDVLAAIQEVGFDSAHDFFYVPVSRRKALGYAFIGFPDAEITKEFVQAMTGYRFRNTSSTKVVALVPARIQGMDDTVAHFKRTSTIRNQGRQTFRN
jgi:hypothetical protein